MRNLFTQKLKVSTLQFPSLSQQWIERLERPIDSGWIITEGKGDHISHPDKHDDYLNKEHSYWHAVSSRLEYSNCSPNLCKNEIGSFKTTGMEICERSLPIASFKICQMLIFIDWSLFTGRTGILKFIKIWITWSLAFGWDCSSEKHVVFV